ncbi:hypothetical protein SynA1825c_02118 [Synechococcus sp. A18-25c]|nr:hypothetical protein SynA1825c_02118 [Synechococcus sp. A18-25c]
MHERQPTLPLGIETLATPKPQEVVDALETTGIRGQASVVGER